MVKSLNVYLSKADSSLCVFQKSLLNNSGGHCVYLFSFMSTGIQNCSPDRQGYGTKQNDQRYNKHYIKK